MKLQVYADEVVNHMIPIPRNASLYTQAVEDLTLETTGTFVAPQGSKSLGLGLYALDDPAAYGPFCELPW